MQTVAAEILLPDDEAPSLEFSRQAIARRHLSTLLLQ